jgi:hypothetical protein
MKNITTAMAYLPAALITPEIVAAAIEEGQIELLNHLPEQYLTEDNINTLVSEDKSYWGHFDLDRLPASCRNQAVCNCAVKKHKDNYRHVPDELKTRAMLDELIGSTKKNLHLLMFVPVNHWDKAVIYKGIDSLYREHSYSYSRNRYSYNNESNTNNSMRLIQVLLSFVPSTLKNCKFYHDFFVHTQLSAQDIRFLIPSKYKDDRYYLLLSQKDFGLIPEDKYSYRIFLEAMNGSNRSSIYDRLKDENIRKKFVEYMDDELADASVKHSPAYFEKLPEQFQTAKRILLVIENNPDYYHYDSLIGDYNQKLLTKEVCRALVKHRTMLPQFPDKIWNEEFANFCMENATSFHWFEQMPQRLQTQEIVNRVVESLTNYVQYVHPSFINSHLAMKIYREKRDLKQYLPEKYFSDFLETTGFPEEFFGGETTFADIKNNRKDYTYCQIGKTYIGFYRNERYRDSASYLIMTRTSLDGAQPEIVFNRRVGSFHKTWLEKMLADYDHDFVKPTVSKALKELQTNMYCGVEPAGQKDGIELFHSTFQREIIGFTGRKDGMIVHAETREEVIVKFQCSEKEAA